MNRVLSVDSNISPAIRNQLNAELNNTLKSVGLKRKVNIIVILTEIDDQSYRYAVENNWIGGKRNDVVVFLGLDDSDITWTDVMTFAGNIDNELFHVELRDALMVNRVFNVNTLHDTIVDKIEKVYTLPDLEQFDYLENDITPPTWVIILATIITLVSGLFLTIYFHENDVFSRRFGRFRRRGRKYY